MSFWAAGVVSPDAVRGAAPTPQPVRRVRQEVRDAVAAACFSAGASVAVALTLMLIVSLLGQHS